MLAEQTLVRRLRIRAKTADRTALQRRASQWLAGLDLQSSQVGPDAMLVIRRLTDGGPMRPRIDELAGRASRPARGPVPPGANAVLFTDRAELLACLARDWCARSLSGNWWWRALYPRLDDAATALKAWDDEPRHVPAALDRLARGGDLVAFLARVPPLHAARWMARVAASFQVPELAAVMERAVAVVAVVEQRQRDEGPRRPMPAAVSRPHRPAADAQLAAAIERYAPEILATDGTLEARSTAALGLLLHRAPLSRLASIARAVAVTAEDTPRSDEATLDVPIAALSLPTEPTSIADPPAAVAPAVLEPVASAEPAPSAVEEAHVPIEPTTASRDSVPARSGESPELESSLVVESEFAGALYLVNVAIALGYYGDFTQPLARGLDLSIWEFIGRAASRLVPAGAFDLDALSPLLRRLAREDEPSRPEWDVWFDMHLPLIRERLSAALGRDQEQVGRFVVARHGRIRVTPARLEVRFDLATLPIEIRLSGLDRDPGFVPAAGLSIVFVYV